ncbi:hypothetical protein [Luteibacter sp. E-22]|uniref:hypothetical protein n=1 Tax=Luteibacter sp. E-22 TaxID=3404050 RepID=UPI003CED68F0
MLLVLPSVRWYLKAAITNATARFNAKEAVSHEALSIPRDNVSRRMPGFFVTRLG